MIIEFIVLSNIPELSFLNAFILINIFLWIWILIEHWKYLKGELLFFFIWCLILPLPAFGGILVSTLVILDILLPIGGFYSKIKEAKKEFEKQEKLKNQNKIVQNNQQVSKPITEDKPIKSFETNKKENSQQISQNIENKKEDNKKEKRPKEINDEDLILKISIGILSFVIFCAFVFYLISVFK